jgi:hypothetical protein
VAQSLFFRFGLGVAITREWASAELEIDTGVVVSDPPHMPETNDRFRRNGYAQIDTRKSCSLSMSWL